jgi:hypothetical protein
MFVAWAPFVRTTPSPVDVVRVVAIWKMKMAERFPWPFNVSVPDEIAREDVDL